MIFAVLGVASTDETGHLGLLFACCAAMRIVLESRLSVTVLSLELDH